MWYLLAFLAGVLLTVIVGYFVWKNNQKKWNQILSEVQTQVSTGKPTLDALKKSINELVSKYLKK